MQGGLFTSAVLHSILEKMNLKMSMMSLAGRVATALVLSATLAFSAEDRSVDWSDLVDPSVQTYEDPFEDLNYQQIESLRTIVRNRELLNDPTLNEARMADSAAKINTALEELAEDGIDADWLIDQRWIVADRRKKAATAANPNLDGQTVTLAGYAIPAPLEADGTAVVYLVPERGMCSHTPPPNANQMIRARVGGDWSPSTMHEPVRLTGKLSIEETNHTFRVVDGNVPMSSSYVLEVSQTETMQDLMTGTSTTNDWAESVADNILAAGHRKTGGVRASE
ncbi:DUF3299 domain-containing protein [Ruegeria sp. Alg231-54]|uniref:DUF3299 domain-containing protein n=1 Tax=Ruegeria sp. Alg231-54 TaxID=1922221 RepID=UPI001F3ACD24|nr:DUF3299 domain-containing protein [Ruegeria sp. Alg231-54]